MFVIHGIVGAMDFSIQEEQHLSHTMPQMPSSVWSALRELHTEEHRQYHTWSHALSVLSWTRFVELEVGEADIHPYTHKDLKLAALFHDAVYDVRSKTNEEDSARLLVSYFPNHSRAADLVSLTSMHGSIQHPHPGVALFLDCDMAFMYAETRFDLFYCLDKAVREEYLAAFSPDQVAAGRKHFLEGLASKNIFLSSLFRERFEATAQENLCRLLSCY